MLTVKIEHSLPYCVYVLLSEKDGYFCVGFTTGLPRRLDEHTDGRNTSTAPRRSFALIHYECYRSRSDAERRQRYLKVAKGRRTLRFMLQDTLRAAND